MAKAQHEPHIPWSLTAVTTPSSLQSFFSGRSLRFILWVAFGAALKPCGLAMFKRPLAYCALNSSSRNSQKLFFLVFIQLEFQGTIDNLYV